MSADAAMAGVEKMMMAMPDTLDHGAVAAKYTAQAQALEEKAAMHNIPGQGSRSRHLALLWEEMSARYSSNWRLWAGRSTQRPCGGRRERSGAPSLVTRAHAADNAPSSRSLHL